MSSSNEQPDMRPRLADPRSGLMTDCTGAVRAVPHRATPFQSTNERRHMVHTTAAGT